ncbi:DUF2339 domain-containing protein [Reyranella soli]|uniref:Membrane protein n=1 Tax=Reyranella soli TaxID=1230389 RepID=A0A512N9A3_9HYPH|nr:DUF2339 domain-containing protein [Reyranella soli]GEP55560.1 membrane protein [Reyranella soli]
MEEIFLILVGIAWAVGTPIIAIVALVRTGRLRDQNERLTADLARLKRQMAETPLPPPFVDQPATEAVAPPSEPLPEAAPGPLPDPLPGPVAEPPPAPPFEPEPTPLPPPMPVAAPAQVGWEQRLGARAFVWVGAVTLALAAVFLVRYSIEEGYLSPEVRVILAALFGFALIGVAERVRSRDDRVAQALAAAGVAALYGALFSAVALYDMISKVAAGGGAAALTGFAIGVSLRHGIFVAGLAFVGGFASPAIIGSETPNTPVLFGYLLAIAAGTLAVIHLRGWWPLGWGVLVGSALWTLLWMQSLAGGIHWVGLFLVAVAGLFVWATWRRLQESDNPTDDVALMVWLSLGVTGALIVALIIQDNGRQAAGWLALAAHGLGLFVLARWTPRFQYVAALAPVLSIVALAAWWADSAAPGAGLDDERFAWRAASFGGFYAAVAFALLWNAARPGFWAALAVAAALAHFMLCWFVLRSTAVGTPWGLISIALALPFLVGAERLARWRDSMPGATEALGYCAAGVAFFIAIAIALELRREWITVAYAVEFAAVAGIAAHLGLHAMRRLCWLLLAAVVVRFVLNPEVLKYPLGVTPIFNWILWGYGLAIAAFVVGLRFLRPTGDEPLVRATEAAIALLVFVLLTLQVRSIFRHDAMMAPDARFMERAFYVLVWGAFALAALWLARTRRDVVALWAWRVSGGLAVALAVVVQVLVANPIFDRADVGRLPIANGLFLAYALPAVMAAVARRWIDVEPSRNAALLAEAAASILAFAYVSFEVRHLFDPGFERRGLGASGLELYVYSAVWLLFGVALLALGFLRSAAALRHAGMALVCIVVAKVFLVDMAGLQGLLRVFSFLGLGAALVGLGYAYRRFGFR